MADRYEAVVVAAFIVLGYARSRSIDLGVAGERLLAALDDVAPGSSARLSSLCPGISPRAAGPQRRRQFISDSRRKPGRVAQVNPIERKPVDAHEPNGRA